MVLVGDIGIKLFCACISFTQYFLKFLHLSMLHNKDYQVIITSLSQFQYKLKKMEWKQVSYSKSNANVPAERWGHRMVYTQTNELVLFGGFGGSPLEGRYLDDVWSFSITNCTWQRIVTTGPFPESRSNYTLHYDDTNNLIILFGGSSDHKTRTNIVAILNWSTKVWTRHIPAEDSDAPWERTYHSSEFLHPYLIIYGGEGVFGQDLNDMWAFHIKENKWRKVTFTESEIAPKKRRFHSTALVNKQFYVIGGCNESYTLLGDMFKVNLQDMFTNDRFWDYKWQCVYADCPILSRWGHSSLIYQGKIYIVGGKINSSADYDLGVTFDPLTQDLTATPVHQFNILPPRRRHASAIVGNSLLIFGGFNGKYLNDFYYLALKDTHQFDFHCIAVEYRNQMMEELDKYQQKCEGDMTIKLIRNSKVQFLLKSYKNRLQKYEFFANLLKYSPQQNNFIELPNFCDVTMFRLVHLCLIEQKMLFCLKFSIQYWFNLILSYEYFVCPLEMQAFSHIISRVANQDNCLQLLQMATQLGLEDLKRTSAEVYWLHNDTVPKIHRSAQETIESNNHLKTPCIEQITHYSRSERQPSQSFALLEDVYETIKFDVEQKKMKGKSSSFFSKTAKKFKSVFRRPNSDTKTSIMNVRQERILSLSQAEITEQSKGCFHRFVNFLTGICERSENRQQQRN